jgi:hypothetical protein
MVSNLMTTKSYHGDTCRPLHSIVRRKSDTIDTIMATSPPDVTFRRDLIGLRLVAWNSLLHCLDAIQLSLGPDEFRWNLHANGTFSVDSLYKVILQSGIPVITRKFGRSKYH